MGRRIRRTASLALSLALTLPAGSVHAEARQDEGARIVHALNRLAYGPRPGDVARVLELGLEAWIDLQLHPERIPDPNLETRLATLRTVRLSTPDLLKGYEVPRDARKEIQKKRAELGENASEEQAREMRRELRAKYGSQMKGTPRQVVAEMQQAKVLRATYSERQLDEVLADFWLNHFNVFAQKGPDRFLLGEYEREVIRPRAWGKFEDLLQATAESPAMLFYLDNWLSADPNATQPQMRRGRGSARGAARFGRPIDDEQMMRPRDAGAVTGGERSPVHLGRASGGPGGRGAASPGSRKRGLNENYAREIMELHTLGVDGGYTQKDVTEVARCFTGWTIKGLRDQRPEFAFDSRIHDKGDKVVLGKVIEGGGKDEGETVIHLLATHPSTAHFISLKLARRFVSDEPPKALVDRAAETFRRTGGDIRSVVTTLVASPEFLSRETRGAKVKTPLEFVVSAVRASGARVEDAGELARRIGEMGMPLYMQQPPTGYKDTSDAWVSTSGLLARLNFALDLAAGKVGGVTVDPARLVGVADASTVAESLAARLVPAGLSESTRKTLATEAGTDATPARIAGLILGSPEFQRK